MIPCLKSHKGQQLLVRAKRDLKSRCRHIVFSRKILKMELLEATLNNKKKCPLFLAPRSESSLVYPAHSRSRWDSVSAKLPPALGHETLETSGDREGTSLYSFTGGGFRKEVLGQNNLYKGCKDSLPTTGPHQRGGPGGGSATQWRRGHQMGQAH